MLLTETIGFDSLKNDEGQSELPIKGGGWNRSAAPTAGTVPQPTADDYTLYSDSSAMTRVVLPPITCQRELQTLRAGDQ